MKTGGSDSGLNLTQGRFLRLPFLLAPSPEQHRIVAKIESLFAKLDEGVAALKRAEANLERYRASVLKAAVEGRLTEEWRKANPPEETGEELLRRILAERRERWEAEQLAKFEAKGRKPPKNWKAKYKEPVAPDTTRVAGTAGRMVLGDGGSASRLYGQWHLQPGEVLFGERRIPCLRMYNIVEGELVLRDLKRMILSEDELNRYGLKSGDLLINRVNSRDLVGKAAAIPGGLGDIVFELQEHPPQTRRNAGYRHTFFGMDCFVVFAPASALAAETPSRS